MAKIRLRMGTIGDVKRTLVRISNLVINNEIDTKTANTIILACNAILSSIRTDDQQKKIDELERLLERNDKY